MNGYPDGTMVSGKLYQNTVLRVSRGQRDGRESKAFFGDTLIFMREYHIGHAGTKFDCAPCSQGLSCLVVSPAASYRRGWEATWRCRRAPEPNARVLILDCGAHALFALLLTSAFAYVSVGK